MFGCKCCRCSNSIESLDLSKPSKVIKKREKLTDAEAKSYKKLRLSSFIPAETYFVDAQKMNFASTSQIESLTNEPDKQTKVKKIGPLNSSSQETKPKLAFQPIYEDEIVNEAETLIGPNNRTVKQMNKSSKKKNKKLAKLELELEQDGKKPSYNFDHNLYNIKKNISVWCIDIALLTSNGQTLRNLLNKGSHHLAFLFEKQLHGNSNDLILPSDENEILSIPTTTSSISLISNTTYQSIEDEDRKKFNDLWSFYLFMFNLGLVCSSILLQLLVGILLLLNAKSNKYSILVLTLFLLVINVFLVIFIDEG